MVEARRVSETPLDLENAQPVDNPEQYQSAREKDASRSCSNIAILVAMPVCLLIVFGVVISVVTSTSGNNADNSIAPASSGPTTTPTMAPTPFLIDGLPDYTQVAILTDDSTPQAKAYQWVKEDP